MLFLILWLGNLMLILLYYNMIYLYYSLVCLWMLYFKLNHWLIIYYTQNLLLFFLYLCWQLCTCLLSYCCFSCTFVDNRALVCWTIFFCSYDYNYDVTCCCYDYRSNVIWIYCYYCSYDVTYNYRCDFGSYVIWVCSCYYSFDVI
jgi:hypothetical protein